MTSWQTNRWLQIHAAWPAIGWRIARQGFVVCAWLTLATTSHQGRTGPFSWGAFFIWPGTKWAVGPLILLPLATLVSGLLVFGRRRAPRPWNWGWPGTTWPVLGLIGLAGLNTTHIVDGPQLALAVIFFWGCYVWVINFRPNFLWPFASLIVLHSLIALAQFGLQHDLGLHWLGEPSLNPQQHGIGVVLFNGQRWLRGYGLTNGPNTLGWKLALLMLWVWPHGRYKHGWQGLALSLTLLVGGAGSLVSLSRSAWLGLAVGAGCLALGRRRSEQPQRLGQTGWLALGGLGLGLALFLWRYGDLVYGRFLNLNQPLEYQSLLVRWRDTGVALTLWSQHPWLGVGAGAYRQAAQALYPVAHNVHNVPLRVGVELGIPGFGMWLVWLALPYWRLRRQPDSLICLAPWSAMIVISLWQPGPSLYEFQASLMLACLCAAWGGAGGV